MNGRGEIGHHRGRAQPTQFRRIVIRCAGNTVPYLETGEIHTVLIPGSSDATTVDQEPRRTFTVQVLP